MKIKLLILDIDGILTDGTKVYAEDGMPKYKRYCDRDFTAIKRFKASGVKVCFLSGDNRVNEAMAKNRKTDFYYARGNDKVEFLEQFESKYDCLRSEMIYVGDDIFDMNIMKEVGRAYCPFNSPKEIKDISYIINAPSGDNLVMRLYDILVSQKIIKPCTLQELELLDKLETF